MRFSVDETNVKVLGRTIVRNGIRYFNYSCSGIEFEFTGTKAEAVLWSDSPSLEDDYKAWVAVFVDDEEQPSRRFPLDNTEDTYLLYQGTIVKKTKIRLVKYSEAAFGKVGIKAIILDNNTSPLPTEMKAKKLEFVGDSITCGYGNEGIFNTDSFHTAQENPWDAYAAKTARKLNADYHLICWSGIGIISNYTELDVPNDGWLMPELYPYTDKAADLALGNTSPELWDNNRYVPDCIIINLGTNDASYTKNITERVEVFGNEYYKFIKQVRSNNPTSTLLCTLGTMGQDLCDVIEQQVQRMSLEGDNQIYYMKFDLQREEDGISSDWHPSKITHEKMSIKLENKIREIMGW